MAVSTQWTVRDVEAGDEARWRELYLGYADFYREAVDDAMLDRLWSWLRDSSHPVTGLVVTTVDGTVVGFAHHREFPRPLGASTGLFLDDLFVEEASRGAGAAAAVLARLREVAAGRGCGVVRWITAEDNHRAQAAYDRVARRTTWLTYDMPVELPAGQRS